LFNSKIQDYENLKGRFESGEREIAGFGEIEKSKDEQIDALKEELKELKINFEEEENQHSTTKVEQEKFQSLYNDLKSSYDDISEKYRITNKQRNMLELNLKHQTDLVKDLKENIKERDKTIEAIRRENDSLEFRAQELKRDVESKKFKIATNQKQFNLR
jgi:chromosome segregation ATPase